MKWVLIDGTHINTDNVRTFYWNNGVLYIFYTSGSPNTWSDPDKARYIRLCHLLGLRPAED